MNKNHSVIVSMLMYIMIENNILSSDNLCLESSRSQKNNSQDFGRKKPSSFTEFNQIKKASSTESLDSFNQDNDSDNEVYQTLEKSIFSQELA